jgi:hypothetical protein
VERARAALVRSLDLEPEFVPAAERLARLDLERGGDLAFVLDLVEYAIRRSPGRPALIALLEEIWVALGGVIGSVPTVARILALGPEEPPLGPGQDASDDAREAARRVSQEFFPAGPESEAVAVQVSVQSRSAAGDEGSGIPPSIPDGEIVRLTPRTPVEGAEVRGVLTGLECTEGLTVLLEVDGSIRRFHTDRPETIEFLGYGGGVGESIACGPLTPALPATITYRPGASEESLGEPLLIEIDSP